jgi:hypothetical protein
VELDGAAPRVRRPVEARGRGRQGEAVVHGLGVRVRVGEEGRYVDVVERVRVATVVVRDQDHAAPVLRRRRRRSHR